MEPIRIAQVMGKMLYGGTESVVMNYYRHIDRSKVQFDFIADSDSKMPIPRKDEIESMGGRVFIVPPYQKINEYIPALVKLFKEQDYKIIHVHLNTINVFPLYAAKKAGVPVRISHSHSTAGKGETKKNILKYMLRPFAKLYPNHYAACSYYAGEWLFGKRSMERGEVTVFNNAIELDKYKYNEAVRSVVRKELGLEDKFVVGHIGRFIYQKNQGFLIDIFEEVYRRNPNTVLLLIGEGGDMEAIKSKVHMLNLDNNVMFLGNRTDVNRLYQAMDVFVLPSRYEGLPVVGVEAQAAGLPCVLSDKVTAETKITECAEFMNIDQGAQAWADKILRLVGQKRVYTSEVMADGGFDIEKQSARLLGLYEELYSK